MSLIFLVLVVVTSSCRKEDHNTEVTPACIKEKITLFTNSSFLCDDATVDEYRFQGRAVYLFSDGLCIADGGTAVFDNNCKSLGYLGGFAGNRKINGVLFYENAVLVKNIWKK